MNYSPAQDSTLTQRDAVLPSIVLQDSCDDIETAELPDNDEPQAIAGFICVIEYADVNGEVSERFISCRRYELHDGNPLIGAICGRSNRYKLFRCDRILEVTDAVTGESLGTGAFFDQFTVGRIREKAHDWNTTSQRKSLIVAGLNVLCFMARCDGKWHPLEEEVIEDFVCTLWMRKEWEGEPPLDLIRSHARRLAPDGEVFAKAIRQYGHSSTSAKVLRRFVERVVAADGVVCDREHHWSTEFAELLDNACLAEAEARRR
ncbi:hypothetical protein U1763_10375 [Sphingomonas sp. LB2R24]|uniref:tellurite resistance TerB family protein n=1 Tax=Sphingomonas sorbitolis TaxID=3096165 RepID=UPI002FCA9F67